MVSAIASSTHDGAISPDYVEYTSEQKRQWAKEKAAGNAQLLTEFLGYPVNERLPYLLLQVASDLARSVTDRSIIKTRICDRADHYLNSMKVLATAVLHYDLAANLVGTRDRKTGHLARCENSLFADLLNMPARTVDNVIYSLKRSGLYLSIEQREEKDPDESGERVYRGVASIKRINMVLFERLGFGQLFSVQRAKAKQRAEIKRLQKTPAEEMIESYRKADDKLRDKRNAGREAGRKRRQAAVQAQQQPNRTQDILQALEQGKSYEQLKADFSGDTDPDPCADIPY